MLEKLTRLYPRSIVTPFLPTKDPKYLWLKINDTYLGIDKKDLTQKEIELLHIMYPISDQHVFPNQSNHAQKWYRFLFLDDRYCPANKAEDYRVIQFEISSRYDQYETEDWEEAMRSFFPNDITTVFISQQSGLIIEKYSDFIMSKKELHDAIETFESDFFFHIHFFVGQFRSINNGLKNLFSNERKLFQYVRTKIPHKKFFTLENAIPLYLIDQLPESSLSSLFWNIESTFENNKELWYTMKKYLENHSNTSLTAKELFMHRNSLQYRIGKFMEKTNINLKSFSGALITYLACLHYELNAKNKEQND